MKNNEYEEALFNRFGLCPDYKIVFAEGDWVEFYAQEEYKYKNVPTYDYHKPEFEKGLESIFFPHSKKLHLDFHSVKLENGMTLSANFAVDHSYKMIFLKVDNMGKFGTIENYK